MSRVMGSNYEWYYLTTNWFYLTTNGHEYFISRKSLESWEFNNVFYHESPELTRMIWLQRISRIYTDKSYYEYS